MPVVLFSVLARHHSSLSALIDERTLWRVCSLLRFFRCEDALVLVDAGHVDSGVLPGTGGLASAARAVLALQQGLAVLVHLDLGDLDLGRVNAHVHGVACTDMIEMRTHDR